MRPVPLPPNVAPRVPMYPTGAPGIGQQLFYGQAPPTLIPQQPGFSFQQQLVPGMRPVGAPIPNFFVPMVHPGQHTQRLGGRRAGAGPMQQTQKPMPLLQQQNVAKRGKLEGLSSLLRSVCLEFRSDSFCNISFSRYIASTRLNRTAEFGLNGDDVDGNGTPCVRHSVDSFGFAITLRLVASGYSVRHTRKSGVKNIACSPRWFLHFLSFLMAAAKSGGTPAC